MITQKRLKQFLNYTPETGIFVWVDTFNAYAVKDDIAGRLTPYGYLTIYIEGKPYYAHRLAWLYVYGEWPPDQIDHIDRVKNNNQIANLRIATRQQNARNADKRKSFTSPYKGVHWNKEKRKWKAQIRDGKAQKHLGYFKYELQAACAYQNKANCLYGEFA